MSYDPEGALAAGIFACVLVVLFLYTFLTFFPRVKLNLVHLLGTIFPVTARWQIYPLGLLTILAMGGGISMVHAAIYEALRIDTDMVSWGLIFGVVQWLVIGLSLGPISRHHPRVKVGAADDLGYFAINERLVAGMAFLVLHVAFAVFCGTFYDALR